MPYPPQGFGASTFLALGDTPDSYTGQALKLVKVASGETGTIFDLLLSFTDWYSGDTPTDYPWVFEANNPVDWDPYFSPMVKNDIGQYIVYVGGYNVQRFYKYNITTKQWHRLADPPAVIFGAISMSPDGSKLAAHGLNGNILFIYDIGANTWSSSSAAPQIDTTDSQIQSTVWADNDTVWCQMRAYVSGTTWTVKCFRYVVSTDTWTQFTNSITPTVHNSQAMGISPDGTTLYFGQCGSYYYTASKYVIATDTYTVDAINIGSTYYFTYCSDKNRLWYGQTAGSPTYAQITSYVDLSDESLHAGIFPTNPQRDKLTNITAGVFETTGVIVFYRTSEPKNMSYFGTGSWKLVEKTLTDYNLVVFRKPADGYAILAIDKVNGFTIPIYIFDTLTLPAGTWEFFYPKDGDYTKLKISGSVLK